MTDEIQFLAVKPLSVKTTRASCADAVILNVMRHNARELQAEIGIGAESGIDPSRIHLNVTLHGPATADGVASAARDAMREHGIAAPRKNATLGIEIVVSLPAGLPIDQLAYFRDAMAWSQQRYRVPLLSAILHNDESHPHLHLVLLPVRDGKLVGSELLGNRATMKAMQKDFHDQVAKQYGLRMPAAKKRQGAAQRAAGIALLRDALQTNSGLTDSAIDALLVPHAKDPEPLLVALGLTMPEPAVKGLFVATMTRKVRPENPNRSFKKSPIGDFSAGMAISFEGENEMSYALLGDCISSPIPAQEQPLAPATNSTVDQRQQSATEIKVRAERKCGEMLSNTELRTGGDAMKARSDDSTKVPPTLADMGLTKDQSSRYQQLAAMPADQQQPADTRLNIQEGLATTAATLPPPADVPKVRGLQDAVERTSAHNSPPTGQTSTTGGGQQHGADDHIPAQAGTSPAQPPLGNGIRHNRHAPKRTHKEGLQDAVGNLHHQRDADHLATGPPWSPATCLRLATNFFGCRQESPPQVKG